MRLIKRLWPILLLCIVPVSAIAQDDFADKLNALTAKKFQDKEQAILVLEQTAHPRTSPVLEAMLGGDLYYVKKDRTIVIAQKSGKKYRLNDAISGADLGAVSKRKIKRISVNNKLRSVLRTVLARLSLASPDRDTRLSAVQQIIETINSNNTRLIRSALEREQDPEIRSVMQSGLALAELSDPDPEQRIQAAERLRNSLSQEVRNRLTSLLDSESEPQVKAVFEDVLNGIQRQREFYQRLETLFFGLSLGSVLFLAAIGLAITFGVMGVINMAHGELIMLGAYTTYLIQSLLPGYIEYSLLLAIPAAFIVSGLFGIAIERSVIQFLYGRPLETLLATFGISLILQQLVRTTISAQNVPVSNPHWMSGLWQINEALALTFNRLYIFIFALLVFVALLLILKKTALGLQVRAVSQNRTMAKAMGIRTEWVDAMTFGLGSGIAGIAGVALSQLTNVGPNLGQAYIVDSFMVVVFGGVGNLWGTLVGALSLGVVNKFLEPFAGAVLAKILVLVFIILFIQKRPRGLFPQKGRAVDH